MMDIFRSKVKNQESFFSGYGFTAAKFLVCLASVLLFCFALQYPKCDSVHAQTVKKNDSSSLPRLKPMQASLDKSMPTSLSQITLKGGVSDSRNPSMIAIPRSGSANAYNAGLKLFKQGDYNRAMTAFKVALARAAKYGSKDARYISAQKAIKSTSPYLTPRARLGYDTDNKKKSDLTGNVTKVFPPDLAWLGGLKVGDQILSAKETATKVFLKVRRNNKVYGLSLSLVKQSASSDTRKPTVKSLSTQHTALRGKINHPELLDKQVKRLLGYDCILMLDCSGSMGDRIVSLGRRNGRLTTRWNWCKSEILRLYRSGKNYFPEGITLVPFANNFAIINEARDASIQNMFKQLTPVGGTNMTKPLAFLIDDYFRRKARNRGKVKPIVIAILSDGEGNAHQLRQVINRATHLMTNEREIVITFLAVDATELGRPVIDALDNNLKNAGAKYDIVDSRSFEELRRYGLLKMLVAAVLEPYVERR